MVFVGVLYIKFIWRYLHINTYSRLIHKSAVVTSRAVVDYKQLEQYNDIVRLHNTILQKALGACTKLNPYPPLFVLFLELNIREAYWFILGF